MAKMYLFQLRQMTDNSKNTVTSLGMTETVFAAGVAYHALLVVEFKGD